MPCTRNLTSLPRARPLRGPGAGPLEGADELLADDLALALRLGDACEGVEEVVGGVDGDEADAGRGDEVVLDLLDFALAQQTVVHEHAGELVADGLVYQSGGHGGINAAGQAADHLGVATCSRIFLT